jgi:hypothetical protein
MRRGGVGAWLGGIGVMIGFRDRRPGRRGVSVASKKSKVNPNYKTRYKVRNWASYDKTLVRRGDLTIWLSPTAVEAGRHCHR